LRRWPKLELCRQARAPSGRLTGNADREIAPGSRCRSAMAQGESALEASRAAARRGAAPRRSRKHSSPQGARERSRLQKSVRRIFLAARSRPPQGGSRRRGIARGDPAAFDEAAPGSQRATGCGAICASEQRAQRAHPGRKVRDDPMEGAPVSLVAVVLNRRRQRQIWRGGGARPRRPAREPSRSGDRARRRGSEPAISRPPCDMGYQKLACTVRLPQPMGAGGRRPPDASRRGGSVPHRYAGG
jgi:hypothetical protein